MAGVSELQIQVRAVDQASKQLRSIASGLKVMGDNAASSQGNLSRLKGASDSLFGSFTKLAGGVAIGTALGTAFAQAPAALTAMAHAAADDAASVAKLKQAVENSGASWDRVSASMDATVKLAQKMGYEDDQARDALALLTAQTNSASEAQTRFKLAMDLSRGANVDLFTASKLLGKVTEENVNVLNRYGIVIEKGASQAELFAAVQQKFSGQAQAFADSSAGAFARAQIAAHEFGESLGRVVLPAFTATATAGAKAADQIGAMADRLTIAQPVIGSLAGSLPSVTAGLALFGAGFAAIKTLQFVSNLVEAQRVATQFGGRLGLLSVGWQQYGATIKTALASPVTQIAILTGSLAALNIVSEKFTGQSLIEHWTLADERARGAAAAVKVYDDSIKRLNADLAAGVAPQEAYTRALLTIGDQARSAITGFQDQSAALRKLNDDYLNVEAGAGGLLSTVKQTAQGIAEKLTLGVYSSDLTKAAEKQAEFRAQVQKTADQFPEFVTSAKQPGIALQALAHEVDVLTSAMDKNDPSRKALTDGLAKATVAVIDLQAGTHNSVGGVTAFGDALDGAAGKVGSLAYNASRAAAAGRPFADALDEIAGQAGAAAAKADELASAFSDLEKIFNRPTLEQLRLNLAIDETQALIDKYNQMGQEVPKDLQKWHDALVANQTTANSVAKTVSDSADIIAKQFQDAGIPIGNLQNLLGSLPHDVAVNVVTKLVGLNDAQEAERVVEVLAKHPGIPIDVAIALAGLKDAQDARGILDAIAARPTINVTVAVDTANAIRRLQELEGIANRFLSAFGASVSVQTPQVGNRAGGSYAEGGVGSFGSGELAMLHGHEAILPLDKPKRTEAILHKLGVKGYADGGFTTGNLPPSLQQQYDRLGTVTGSSGGSTAAFGQASNDLLALADAFKIFHEQTGEGTDAFAEYLDAQKLVTDAATQSIQAQQEVADAQRQGRVELRAMADILGKAGITGEAFVAQQGLLALRDAYRQSGLATNDFIDSLRGLTADLLATGRKMAHEGHQAINSFAVPAGAIPGYGAAGNLTDEGLRKVRKSDPRLDKYLTEHPDAVRRYDPVEELRKKLFGSTQTTTNRTFANYGTINVTQQQSPGTDINALSRSLF